MCHGMGLTASAVGERITLVWSLTEPQWGLDLTSLSRLSKLTDPLKMIESEEPLIPLVQSASQL